MGLTTVGIVPESSSSALDVCGGTIELWSAPSVIKGVDYVGIMVSETSLMGILGKFPEI